MSSYLTIYALDVKKRQCVELFCTSRSSEIYQELYENGVKWIGDLDCKEWYQQRKSQYPNKQVKTKEEAIEPIPENEAYNKWMTEKHDNTSERPKLVYYGYFIEEEYDSLPHEFDLINKEYTSLTHTKLQEIISDLTESINKSSKRLDYYNKIAQTNFDAVEEALSTQEYIDDQKSTLDFFKHLNMLECELRCGID